MMKKYKKFHADKSLLYITFQIFQRIFCMNYANNVMDSKICGICGCISMWVLHLLLAQM